MLDKMQTMSHTSYIMAEKNGEKMCTVQMTESARQKLDAICEANGGVKVYRQLGTLVEAEYRRLEQAGRLETQAA